MSNDTTGEPVGLAVELEQELRSGIDPKYEDARGTQSYERKRLLGEIDRLRERIKQHRVAAASSTTDGVGSIHPNAGMVPCPFCGSTPDEDDPNTFVESQGNKWGAAVCGCGARGPEVRTGHGHWYKWKFRAIEEWNKRASGDNP